MPGRNLKINKPAEGFKFQKTSFLRALISKVLSIFFNLTPILKFTLKATCLKEFMKRQSDCPLLPSPLPVKGGDGAGGL